MKKVLIISTSRSEERLVTEALINKPGAVPPGCGELKVETTASFGQEATWWVENAPDCLILCLPEDDLMQTYFLTKLRNDVPRQMPIILLSSFITTPLMHLSQIFNRVRLLKNPVDGETFVKNIVELTIQWAPGQTQIHPRYLTEQDVMVSSEMSNGKLRGVMKNLSLSGAYLETLQMQPKFKSGDIVKMSVQVGAPAKDYVFDAKVVWVKPLEADSGCGYGVTFVNRDEVYNHLLRGL